MKLPLEKQMADGRPLPPDRCPVCQYDLDAASPFSPTSGDLTQVTPRPQPGDMTLCMKCGEFLVFEPDMRIRMALPLDLLSMDAEQLGFMTKAQRLLRMGRFIA